MYKYYLITFLSLSLNFQVACQASLDSIDFPLISSDIFFDVTDSLISFKDLTSLSAAINKKFESKDVNRIKYYRPTSSSLDKNGVRKYYGDTVYLSFIRLPDKSGYQIVEQKKLPNNKFYEYSRGHFSNKSDKPVVPIKTYLKNNDFLPIENVQFTIGESGIVGLGLYSSTLTWIDNGRRFKGDLDSLQLLSIKKELSEFLMLHLDSTEEEMITARLSFKTISISTDDYLSLLESLKKIIYPSLATSFYSDKEKMRQADPNLDSLHGGLFLNKYHKWTHIYGNRYSGLIRRDTIISYDSTYIEYKRVNKKATYSDSDKTTTFTTVIDTVSLRFNEIQNGVYACYYDISKSLIDTSSWSGYPYKQRDTLRSLYSILSSDVSFEYINIYDLPNQFAFTTYRNPSFSSADAKSHFIKTMSTNFHKSLIRTYDIPHILLEVKLKNKPILSVMLPSDQKRRLLLQLE